MEENLGKVTVGEIILVMDENDAEQEMEVLGILTVEGMEYAALAYVADIDQETSEEIDIYFFRVEEDGDLSFIENDEEFDKVSAAFDEAGNE